MAGESVSTYRFFRAGAAAGEITARAQPPAELFFLDQARDQKRAQPHRYAVIAVNPAGESEASRAVSAGALELTTPPPAGARAAADTKGVTLTWTATPGCRYTVQRKAGPTGPAFVLAGGLAAATHLDATAIAGVAYVYEITATDATGNVSEAASVTITP